MKGSASSTPRNTLTFDGHAPSMHGPSSPYSSALHSTVRSLHEIPKETALNRS